MTPSDICVMTACFYPDESQAWRLSESCRNFGIPLRTYGVGESFTSWRHAKMLSLIDEIKNAKKDFRYILYTDANDTWFLNGLDIFIERFLKIAATVVNDGVVSSYPMAVVSGEKDCYPFDNLSSVFPDRGPFRYPNAGQFFGDAKYIQKKLTTLEKRYREDPLKDSSGHLHGNNDQGYWLRGFADQAEVMDRTIVDVDAELFQTMSSSKHIDDDFEKWNAGHSPVSIHFNGGDKEEKMKRYWERMPWISNTR